MMTCKDCLHYGVCSGYLPSDLDKDVFDLCAKGLWDKIPDIDERCSDFKDRSRYVVREKGENLNADTPSLFGCSKCGWCCWDTYTSDTGKFNFCPNCGADMTGGDWRV